MSNDTYPHVTNQLSKENVTPLWHAFQLHNALKGILYFALMVYGGLSTLMWYVAYHEQPIIYYLGAVALLVLVVIVLIELIWQVFHARNRTYFYSRKVYERSKALSDAIRQGLPRRRDDGYVYVIQDVDVTGFCKIGRTVGPASRMLNFDVLLPFEVHIITIIKCKRFDSITAERLLHRYYARFRVRGEWFSLSYAQIERLRKETEM